MINFNEYINTTVLQENKPVTYKSLARSLKIHVDTAKQALYTFSKENKSSVHAVYCITGSTVKNSQLSIQLVKETDLEDVKKNFKDITGLHVYGLTAVDPIDFTILYGACKDVPKLSMEERYACGVFKNACVTVLHKETRPQVDTRRDPYVYNKPTAVTPTPSPAPKKSAPAKKGTLSFATSKKPAEKPKEKKVITGVKRKNTQDDIETRLAKTTIKPEDIFSSDEEEVEKEDVPQEEEALQDEIMTEAEPELKVEEVEVSDGKTKRKVLKKKTTMNARGHMVTEEVWEWETVDASEIEESKPAAAAAKSRPPPPAAKKTAPSSKKKAPTAQTNLFSFFNKK